MRPRSTRCLVERRPEVEVRVWGVREGGTTVKGVITLWVTPRPVRS